MRRGPGHVSRCWKRLAECGGYREGPPVEPLRSDPLIEYFCSQDEGEAK